MKVTLLALLAVSLVCSVNESFAEISENQVFLLEGSGFGVTEEVIKISEIELTLSSQYQHGSTIDFRTEGGFITLDDEKFLISNLEGKFLHEGKYLRISGDIESSSGLDTLISFFGRLVDESKDASIYGFTGRITTGDNTYKVIYTTKLSIFSKIIKESEAPENLTLRILQGASSIAISDSYIASGQSQNTSGSSKWGYFSQDRISVEPGTTIIIMNDDDVSHNIISGKENRDRHVPFTPDGRISTGDIAPGESVTITFEDAGFYRLYDPDYTWMKIIAYVFPSSDNVVLGKGQNLGN